jgi:putative oxidoreductase
MKVAAISAGILSPTGVPYLVAAIDLFDRLLILVPTNALGRFVLIAFIALTIVFAHNFWTMEGAARSANQAHFYKNLGLIGGLAPGSGGAARWTTVSQRVDSGEPRVAL